MSGNQVLGEYVFKKTTENIVCRLYVRGFNNTKSDRHKITDIQYLIEGCQKSIVNFKEALLKQVTSSKK